MKNVFAIFIAFCSMSLHAQEKQIATASYKGILVLLGKSLPNNTGVESYTIERKETNGDKWAKLADVKMPAELNAFLAKLKTNRAQYVDYYTPTDKDISKNWNKFQAANNIDSLRYVGQSIAVQLTCGTMFYDNTAKENVSYQYKVTQNGRMTSTAVSNVVKYPFTPAFDSIAFRRSAFNKIDGLTLTWYAVGKKHKAPETFRVYRYVNEKPVALSVFKKIYKSRDTTYYQAIDTSAREGFKYQYAMFPFDQYGNHGKSTPVALAYAFDFKNVYFKTADAKKNSVELAIDLTWELSSAAPVEHIDIFRSSNSNKEYTQIGSVGGTAVSFKDNSIQADKVYYYVLHAYKFYSDDSIVSARFFDYGLSTKKGLAPVVAKSNPVKNGVYFELLLPEQGNSSLLVYRKEKTSQPLAVIAEVFIRDTARITYTDTTAKDPYMIYQYAFAVKSKSFITSDTSTITQSRSGVPGAPKGVKNFSGYYQDKAVNLRWEVDSTQEYLLGYLLEKRILDEKGKALTDFKNIASVKQVVLTGNHFTDTLLLPGKTYEYRVTAVDDHYRESADKLSKIISIPAIMPVAPAGLKSVITTDGVVLEWGSSINDNAKSYKLYRYQRGKDPVSIATLPTDQHTYTDKSAAKGELYFYYLTTLSTDNKESLPSDEVGARFQP